MKKIIIIFVFIFFHTTFNVDNIDGQWMQTAFNKIMSANFIVAKDSNIYISIMQGGFYFSNNNGNSVISINNGIPGLRHTTCLKICNDTLYGGNIYHGIYKTTNNGRNWFSNNDINTCSLDISSIDISNLISVIGTSNGVYKTTNEGLNWNNINNDLPFSYISQVFFINNTIFAGGYYVGLYRTTNSGINWTKCLNGFPDSCWVTEYTILNNIIFIACYGTGVFKTSDFGNTWINCTQGSSRYVSTICSSLNYIFAGVTDCNVLYSDDYGKSWKIINNNGITGFFDIYKIASNSDFVFATRFTDGVWRRRISEIIGIQNISSEIPLGFKLYQNHPNPFNSMTNVKFQIPLNFSFPSVSTENSYVTLKIFDLLGREVATLINERLEAGVYEVKWDGGDNPSGIYFCCFTAGDFSDTKRMLLLK